MMTIRLMNGGIYLNRRTLRRTATVVWLAALVLAYPLCQWLGPEWGWENGRLEWFQVLVLCGLIVLAAVQAKQAREMPVRRFWQLMIPVFVFMLLREMTWGAVLFPPVEVGADGPHYMSRKDLPYGALVHPAVGIGMIFWLWAVFRCKLVAFFLDLVKSRRIPWLEMGLGVVAAVLATAVERHILSVPSHLVMVMEEYFETLMYLAMVLVFLRMEYQLSDSASRSGIR